jgi:ligand-binding SRPBCC domain-containing protein
LRRGPALLGNGEYVLTSEVRLMRPLAEVFALFADAFALGRITPPWLHFAVLTPAPIPMGPGARIDYRLRIHGLPIRWQSEISVWEPPFRFVDEQRRGPYRFWIHEHGFEARGGSTLVHDRVRYGVPGGTVVHRLLVGPDLTRIFRFRQRVLAGLFGAQAPLPPVRIEPSRAA